LLRCGGSVPFVVIAQFSDHGLLKLRSTILFAGHETTSNTVSWALLELARQPKIQSRLREEIWETEAAVHARGDVDFTSADFDAMPYTTAVMKVRDVVLAIFGRS
jgi:cytochrome P450